VHLRICESVVSLGAEPAQSADVATSNGSIHKALQQRLIVQVDELSILQ
jgi:hypothetical protein